MAEVIIGAGPGGAPRVFALDARSLLDGRFVPAANFFAGDSEDRDGVRVTVKDLDGDDFADLVVGSGPGNVKIYTGSGIPTNGTPEEETPLEVDSVLNSIFVG